MPIFFVNFVLNRSRRKLRRYEVNLLNFDEFILPKAHTLWPFGTLFKVRRFGRKFVLAVTEHFLRFSKTDLSVIA